MLVLSVVWYQYYRSSFQRHLFCLSNVMERLKSPWVLGDGVIRVLIWFLLKAISLISLKKCVVLKCVERLNQQKIGYIMYKRMCHALNNKHNYKRKQVCDLLSCSNLIFQSFKYKDRSPIEKNIKNFFQEKNDCFSLSHKIFGC